MGELAILSRDRHALVERRGPEPQRLTVDALALFPEAHVVAAPWARPHLALEREVLTAPVEEEVADRRARVRAVDRHRPEDAQRAPHGDGTGGEPPGPLHGEPYLAGLSDQTDVDGIGGMTGGVGGPIRRRRCGRHDVPMVLDERDQSIRREQPDGDRGHRSDRATLREMPSPAT